SKASDVGIIEGDAIMAVNGRDVGDTKNLLEATRRSRKFRLLVIGATKRDIVVTPN
ncbi:MAG: hypothetical protein GY906_02715, partial [bacterium]|nr:hypothetical protein [bacterium]